MEYLTALLKYKRSHAINEQETLMIGTDLCRALVFCEQKHIVHRDIKPENILVTDTGDFKLGDFGIARTMDHTTTATSVGTKPYMAPEVIKGEKYDHKVDIYSLGLVLYWLLNNSKLPFMPQDRVPDFETNQNAYNRRIRGDALPEPANGQRALNKIVLKACAYKPSERYRSAQEMLDALSLIAAKRAAEPQNKSRETSLGADGGSSAPRRDTACENEGKTDSSAQETQDNSWEDASGTMGANGWWQQGSGGDSAGKPEKAHQWRKKKRRECMRVKTQTLRILKTKPQAEKKYTEKQKRRKKSSCIPMIVWYVIMTMFSGSIDSPSEFIFWKNNINGYNGQYMYVKASWDLCASVLIWIALALSIAYAVTLRNGKRKLAEILIRLCMVMPILLSVEMSIEEIVLWRMGHSTSWAGLIICDVLTVGIRLLIAEKAIPSKAE